MSDALDAALAALARPDGGLADGGLGNGDLADGDLSALLDRVEELLRHCGWGGSLRGDTRGVPSVGPGAGEPLVEAYVCPTARCTRAVFAPRPPVCSFTTRSLVLKRYGGYGDGHDSGHRHGTGSP